VRTGLCAFAPCFAALALAAAPSLHALDSGELAAAGVRLGLSHPPGQPAHALLVKAATLLPLGDIGFRANLVSVLGAAMAAALLAMAAQRLGARSLVAAAIGLAVAMSGPVVENATRVEVYTPALSLVALALLAAHAGSAGDRRGLAASGVAAGLAACLHPAAGIAVVLAHVAGGLRLRDLRSHVCFAAGTIVGALPLVTVLVRGPRDPLPAWDAPRSLADAIAFWTGAGYAKNFALWHVPLGLLEAGWVVTRGTGFVLVAGAVVLAIRGRDRRAGALLLAAIVSLLPVAQLHFVLVNPDMWGYVLPAMAMVAIAAARGAGRVSIAAAVVVLVPALLLGGAWSGVRPRSRLVEARVEEALEVLPPRAVLVAELDLTVGALEFLQAARGERPDVAWLGSGVATQEAPWARIRVQDERLRSLPALAPVPGDPRDRAVVALLAQSRGRVPAFVEDGRFLPRGREWAGWVELGPGDPRARARWLRMRREVRGDEIAELDIRTICLGIAGALARQGEPRAAGRAILVGLPHPDEELRRLVRSLPARALLRASPPDAALRLHFGPDASAMVRALARVAWRAGLERESVALLERELRAGSDEAGAQLVVLAVASGRPELARATVRRLVRQDPGLDAPLARLLASMDRGR
jgi:hypothetical protein